MAKDIKINIVLDSDVIIHFIRGDFLEGLFRIFPEPNYEYIILDKVYDELAKYPKTKKIVDNFNQFFKKPKIEEFNPGESQEEYFKLVRDMGVGECASMIYCRDNNCVLGSNNYKDVAGFCKDHGINHLRTADFLYYAIQKKIITVKECEDFFAKNLKEGSRLREDMTTYVCHTLI